jgi:hypothetical protein
MKSRSGYATMNEFKTAGIHTRRIREAVDKEIIIKIKPGLYKLTWRRPGPLFLNLLFLTKNRNIYELSGIP